MVGRVALFCHFANLFNVWFNRRQLDSHICSCVQFVCLLFFFVFIYLFLAALGLRCCVWAFSSCVERGLLFFAVRGLLIVVASLVAEHGL